MSLRLLQVVPTYLPATRYGGPIYSVHGLCKALAAAGHEVHVFTTNVDGPDDSDVPLGRPVQLDGVQVSYFASRWLRRLYVSPAMHRALARDVAGFDLVHLHSVFLWPTWAAATAARRAAVPYVLSPRGMLVKDLIARRGRWRKRAWVGLIERRTLAGAAAVHVTSALEADELRRFRLRLPGLVTLPNGVEAPAVLDEGAVGDDVRQAISGGPFVLFLGRINWKKGLERLIEAVARLDAVRLVVVGNDEEDELPGLRRLADDLGLGARMTVLPRAVSGQDKEALFAAARLLALPSLSENFGNVVIEAMARGCPPVVSPAVGAAETVARSGAGLVFDGSVTDLAHCMGKLLESADLRADLSSAGRAAAAADFRWEAIAGRMAAAYDAILSRQAAR